MTTSLAFLTLIRTMMALTTVLRMGIVTASSLGIATVIVSGIVGDLE